VAIGERLKEILRIRKQVANVSNKNGRSTLDVLKIYRLNKNNISRKTCQNQRGSNIDTLTNYHLT
jgi:hypothetical protein